VAVDEDETEIAAIAFQSEKTPEQHTAVTAEDQCEVIVRRQRGGNVAHVPEHEILIAPRGGRTKSR
jgi:hypothetical protein